MGGTQRRWTGGIPVVRRESETIGSDLTTVVTVTEGSDGVVSVDGTSSFSTPRIKKIRKVSTLKHLT